jgi:organic radical activating enzyme
MKQSCRILVGLSCSFKCDYCCNLIPQMIEKFSQIKMDDLAHILPKYPNVCISGGEPLLPIHTKRTTTIASLAKGNVYIYTNLYNWNHDIHSRLINTITGWNIGYHPSQISSGTFMNKLSGFLKWSPRHVRIMCEDTHEASLRALLK